MFKNMFIIITVFAMVCGGSAMGATYQFYHVAVRDFDGNGRIDTRPDGSQWDHVRYGFVNSNGTTAKAYDSNGGEIQTKGVGSPWLYKESNNGGAWEDLSYSSAKFDYNPNINTVKLFDSDGGKIESHTVSLPNLNLEGNLPSTYKGYDPMTVSWQWNNGDLEMQWDGITDPSTLTSSHRLVIEHTDSEGVNWSLYNWLDGNTTRIIFDGDLLSGLVDWDDTWQLHFEQRFSNIDGWAENGNWLRSYSGFFDCNFSLADNVINQLPPNPVPIPGSIFLLGSGIIGLVGFKSRKK
jgi:hypothetical protein